MARTYCQFTKIITIGLGEAGATEGRDAFFDLLEARALGPTDEILYDIDFKVLSINPDNTLQVEVTGNLEVHEDEDERAEEK